MIMVPIPFGQDPMEFNEETSASRVGARIRKIRTDKGLLQADLGNMVGLTADRIQKYENGVRKPKADLLKKDSRCFRCKYTCIGRSKHNKLYRKYVCIF